VRKQQLKLDTPKANLRTYMFNKHVIKHRFCGVCGCAPFGFGKDPKGQETAAVNVRCLPNLDRSKLEIVQYDGRSK
jgi:hypothetical protein